MPNNAPRCLPLHGDSFRRSSWLRLDFLPWLLISLLLDVRLFHFDRHYLPIDEHLHRFAIG
jgi:hypothetical protein